MAGIPNGINSRFYAPVTLPKGLVSDVEVRLSKISIRQANTADDTPISGLLLYQLKDLNGEQIDEFISKLVELRNENKTLLGLTTVLSISST